MSARECRAVWDGQGWDRVGQPGFGLQREACGSPGMIGLAREEDRSHDRRGGLVGHADGLPAVAGRWRRTVTDGSIARLPRRSRLDHSPRAGTGRQPVVERGDRQIRGSARRSGPRGSGGWFRRRVRRLLIVRGGRLECPVDVLCGPGTGWPRSLPLHGECVRTPVQHHGVRYQSVFYGTIDYRTVAFGDVTVIAAPRCHAAIVARAPRAQAGVSGHDRPRCQPQGHAQRADPDDRAPTPSRPTSSSLTFRAARPAQDAHGERIAPPALQPRPVIFFRRSPGLAAGPGAASAEKNRPLFIHSQSSSSKIHSSRPFLDLFSATWSVKSYFLGRFALPIGRLSLTYRAGSRYLLGGSRLRAQNLVDLPIPSGNHQVR
jgi:hypothetical protein